MLWGSWYGYFSNKDFSISQIELESHLTCCEGRMLLMAVKFLSSTCQVHGIISISAFYSIYLCRVGSRTTPIRLVPVKRASRLKLQLRTVTIDKLQLYEAVSAYLYFNNVERVAFTFLFLGVLTPSPPSHMEFL